ncbi:hypothetical protein ACFP65_06065 [Marinilactibacillus sp. GCM10026970]|uniref:hypothetical protein n=1 Tax=Marinilactibacillus sp. GCM10026970 TaxID=3252642 RepID=UPI003615F199
MSKNKSKVMLGIGILLVLLGGYAFFLDPIIGGVGFLCGIWTMFLAIKALCGKPLFKNSTEEEDEKR